MEMKHNLFKNDLKGKHINTPAVSVCVCFIELTFELSTIHTSHK